MSMLSLYGLGAAALVLGIFYFVRRIPMYVASCACLILGFMAFTLPEWQAHRSEWLVTTSGLGLCSFGMLIVRVMLIRSVSLRLLRRLIDGNDQGMGDDIGGRLADMHAFKLIEAPAEACTLTPFGRLVGGVASTAYALFGIGK